MTVIETWLRQDLKGLVTVRSLQGQVFSLDNGGNLIGVKVTKDYKPVTLTGTVTGYCILSDGQTVTVTGSGNAGIQNGNEAYIVLPQLVYSVPGQISIVIKLTSGNTTTTLAACTGYVYRSRTSNEVVPPGTPIPDLATMEEVIRRATAATDAANAATVGAEKVDASMTKEGDVITIAVTDRDGNVTEKTVTDQTEAMKRKADIDGYYEELAAGTADQLVSTEAVTDTTPYLYRKSGGSADVGNRETLEKIVGGTVCWNQVMPVSTASFTGTGWSSQGNNDGSFTITVTDDTASAGSSFNAFSLRANTMIIDHKYLLMGTKYGIDVSIKSHSKYSDTVFICNNVGYSNCTFRFDDLAKGTYVIWPMLFDLTAMFGPTIADYIYNLEQATAGAGVAWFRKLFPKGYYPYNPGELISVKPSSHDMVGFNAFDKTTVVHGHVLTNNKDVSYASPNWAHSDYIPVIPNTTYYYSLPWYTGTYMVHYYNADKMFIGNESVSGSTPLYTMPFNAAFVRLNMHEEDVDTVSFNLSHSGSRNGEYEPYEKHSYPLADVELRGIVGIDENGELVYDGDEYTPDGTVKRKHRLINLGELNWLLYSGYSNLFYVNTSDIKGSINNTTIADFICSKYTKCPAQVIGSDGYTNGFIAIDMSGRIYVNDTNYSDAAAFKTAVDGVHLICELITPTTEQVASYTPVQVVDDWGTEEFVDTREVAIPVGHSTSYMANLRDKLQHLPSLADEDGEYIVKQTGTKMELSKLSSSGLAQGIFVETESAPVVSFADGADGQAMKAVNVAIEPVQDLHGYDSPWPAGGGKNLIPIPYYSQAGTYNGVTVTVNDDGTLILNGAASNTVYFNLVHNSAGIAFPAGDYILHKPVPTAISGLTITAVKNGSYWNSSTTVNSMLNLTESANISFYIQVSSGTVLSNVKVYPMFEKGTTVSDWQPYSNVCPITGWTGAKVTRMGKNLLDLSILRQGNFDNTTTTSNVSFDEFLPIKGGLQYVWSTALSNISGRYIRFYDATKTMMDTGVTAYGVGTKTFTAPENACYFRALWYISGGLRPADITKDQIELGSTATEYEPYLGQTYEVTFPADPGTVYGGALDVVTGKLMVDRVTVTISDLSVNIKFNVGTYTVLKRFALNRPSNSAAYNKLHGATASFGVESAAYFGVQKNNELGSSDVNFAITTDGKSLAIYDVDLSLTDTTFMEKYGSQQVCYPLATPIEYTLSPTEIRTLLGENRLLADCGDSSITYPADTKTYIDNRINSTRKLIAGIETGFTASKLYAVGDMLIIGDDLYKVTAQIASGATITVGTNVTKTTVAEQLIALANA